MLHLYAFINSSRRSLTARPGRRVQWSEKSVYKVGAGLEKIRSYAVSVVDGDFLT